MKFCFMFCTTVFSLLVAASLQAAPITVPTDLNPGDTYRLVFVTFDQRDATDVLIGPYNDFVTTAAAGQPLAAPLEPMLLQDTRMGHSEATAHRSAYATQPKS